MARLPILALLLAWAAQAAAAEVVEPGDVLLVSIAEDARLGRDAAKVSSDGQIQLPMLGGVEVAGSSLSAIGTRIATALEERGILRTPTVLVEIATYRPFYIGGGVANPGAIPFEPGLTVRHAIILAGGVGKAADRSLSLPDLVELRAKWRTNALEIVEVESRIARLNAELERSPLAEPPDVTAGAASGDSGGIVSLDAATLKDRDQEWNAEQAHLKDALAMVDFEIDVLAQQTTLQQSEIDVQNDQLEKSRELREKGLIPLSQLQELEREKSRLSRDMLETGAFTARARQTRATAEYQLESADAKRRIELREALRGALLDRSRIAAETEVIGAALAEAGLSPTDAVPAPVVTIHRREQGQDRSLTATLDTAVLPGDVIDVALGQAIGG